MEIYHELSSKIDWRFLIITILLGVITGVFSVLPLKDVFIVFSILSLISIYILITLKSKTFESLLLWQKLILFLLSGYILFNYGFANISLRGGGLILPIGQAMMLAVLLMIPHGKTLPMFFKEKLLLVVILSLIVLTLLHLVNDIPKYGMWAIRDATFTLEMVFIYIGYIFAARQKSLMPFIKIIIIILAIKLIYTYTFFWRGWIMEISPKVTTFKTVSLLGYHHIGSVYAIVSAVVFLLISRYYPKYKYILFLMAIVSVATLGFLQARSMYIGLILTMVVLILLYRVKLSVQITKILSILFVALLLLSAMGVQIPGRTGHLDSSFFMQHVLSIAGKGDVGPAKGSLRDRLGWWSSTLQETIEEPRYTFIGQGFGKPLIDFKAYGTVVVRQPHNSHISIFARLGIVGIMLWTVFNIYFVARTLKGISFSVGRKQDVLICLFIYYFLFMILTTFQPMLEFSYGAIPFYFFIGFTLYITKRSVKFDHEKSNRT